MMQPCHLLVIYLCIQMECTSNATIQCTLVVTIRGQPGQGKQIIMQVLGFMGVLFVYVSTGGRVVDRTARRSGGWPNTSELEKLNIKSSMNSPVSTSKPYLKIHVFDIDASVRLLTARYASHFAP